MGTLSDIINTYNLDHIKGQTLTNRSLLCEQILDVVQMKPTISIEKDKSYRAPFFVNMEKEIPCDFYTFTGLRPQTMIFYGNYCELELLRISSQINYAYKRMKPIYDYTRKRILSNCFGRYCPTGECFETSITVLRFISAVFPEEDEMIDFFIRNIAQETLSRSRVITYQTELYFLNTLCEIRSQTALYYLGLLKMHAFKLKTSISRGREAFRDTNMLIMDQCANLCSKDLYC